MPESLQNLHEDVLAGYKFDHLALVAILDNLKKNPTDKMKAWMASQSEYKGWNCASLAAYSGFAEGTLKKLKSGEIADPRGSTFARFFIYFGIRPRDVLKCIPRNICSSECVNQTMMQLKAAEKRIAELESARAEDKAAFEMQMNDKQERQKRTDTDVDDLRRDLKTLRRYNVWLLLALVALVVALLVIYLVWEFRNPDQGLTGLIRSLTQ